MNKGLYIFIFAICLIMVLFSFSLFGHSSTTSSNNTTLAVSAMSVGSVNAFVFELKTQDYFVGYNETTAEWLSTMGNNKIFSSGEYYVVMSPTDASKLPIEFATDVFINDTFNCEIVENRSLGVSYPDVLYVKDVEFLNQSREYIEV